VAALADQINHGPVPLAHLDFIQLQAHKFRSAKTTTKQHGKHRVVTLGTHSFAKSVSEHFRTLFCTQPVSGAKAELFNSLDSADARRQLGTEQA